MTETVPDQYDSPWKDAVEHFYPDFMDMYFPEVYAAIDWSCGYTFLDQELRQVVRDAEAGARRVDKLVRVTRLTGGPQLVYIHIEVQGYRDTELSQRIFIYNYRLFDRYKCPIASLVVLADESSGWKPTRFGYDIFGCRVGIEFPVVKLLEWQGQLETLLTNPNPFALVTAAHLMTQATRGDSQSRYSAKRKLVRLLYERGWEKEAIMNLLAVIDWMMHLPSFLEQQLWDEIMSIEQEEHMRYVMSFERLAEDRGEKKGKKEERTTVVELIKGLLRQRFDQVPDWVENRLLTASRDEIIHWGTRVLQAPSVEDVFRTEAQA